MNPIKRFFTQINTRTIYLYSFFTGIIAGGVAILFHLAIHFVLHFGNEKLANMPVLEPGGPVITTEMLHFNPNLAWFFVLPIIGGIVTGLITHFFAPETAGSGTETFLNAFHNKPEGLRKRTGIVKFFASVSTLGTGGSGGKEGPMMMIGSALGTIFGRLIKMGARAQRTLLLAGAAGGLGAIFRTPLGGAITAVEVLYKEDFESDALIPCIISSVTSYTTFGAYLGYGHMLHFSSDIFHSPIELIFYAFLALVCTFAAFIFVKFYHFIKIYFFDKLPVPSYALPAIGGLMIAIIGLIYPEALGDGLGVVQQAIYGTYSANWITACKFFLILAVMKMLTTSFTIQSGGSAGVLVPSFFIGAMLGGLVGTIFHHFMPHLVPSVTPYIVVGMAAFFAAATNASLGALVMVTELTGGYELLPPLMVVAVISLIFSHRWSVYKNQVANKFFSKAHLWDMSPAILKNITIESAFKELKTKAIIEHSMHYCDIKALARKLHISEFLVQNENQKLLGILTLHDLEFEEEEDLSGLDDLLLAEDMIHTEATALSPQDTLFKAMQFLTNTDFDRIPVVDDSKVKSILLGYLTRTDILKFYNELGEKRGTD